MNIRKMIFTTLYMRIRNWLRYMMKDDGEDNKIEIIIKEIEYDSGDDTNSNYNNPYNDFY